MDLNQALNDGVESVTKTEFARLIGKSKGRVSQLVKAGQPLAAAVNKDGQVNLKRAAEILPQLADPTKTTPPPGGVVSTPAPAISEEDSRYKAARAEKMEMDAATAKVARLEKEQVLCHVQAVDQQVTTLFRELRDSIHRRLREVSKEIAGLEDAREVHAILRERVDSVLHEASHQADRESKNGGKNAA